MKRKDRKSICPIGFECLDHPCSNYSYCTNMTYAWDIPYTYEVKNGIPVLTVKAWAWRVKWWAETINMYEDKLQPFRCELPSGHYSTLGSNNDWEEMETRKQIVNAWEEAGWNAALDIPNKKDFDKILDIQPHCLTVNFKSVFPKYWIDCFKGQGFDEPVDLPYYYDLDQKCLIVDFPNDEAKALGWHTATNIWLDF